MRQVKVKLLIDIDWEGELDVRGTMRSPNWKPGSTLADAYSIRALVSDNPINGEYHAKVQTLLDETDLDCSIFELSDFNNGQIFRGDIPIVEITCWLDTQPAPYQ
ncbi:hypothetical protein LCGC14_0526410 [marine sediment metagenome]|uniref:Uncharacterized protein n=1 Tax=marine sediment metagenome TaxID=412755 RepID=A0A0F9UIE8_9ZZZZ